MRDIPGYTLLEPLCADRGTVLYRAVSEKDSLPVFIRTISSAPATPRDLAALEQEFLVGRELDGVSLRPRQLSKETVPALVFDGFVGEPLNRLPPLFDDIGFFLRVATAVTNSLVELHDRSLIHRNISPNAFLVSKEGLEARVTGLSFACHRAVSHTGTPVAAAVDQLPYLSPEQTGRVRGVVDERSDLYSLGMVLYHTLLGSLPFAGQTTRDWLHFHLAIEVASPCIRIPTIPPVVGAIIQKLLRKIPEHRYQTATGLQADLRKCLSLFETKRNIESFTLGEHDLARRVLIPQRLHGREMERSRLINAFERIVISRTPEVVLISGVAGVGKSALVEELQQPLLERRGYLLRCQNRKGSTGECSTFLSGLRALIREVLTESEEDIERLRQGMTQGGCQEIAELVSCIPELKYILGDTAFSVPEDLPLARILYLARRFLSLLVQGKRPLVVVVEDIQWSDRTSISALKEILWEETQGAVLVVLTRNDDEDFGQCASYDDLLIELTARGTSVTKLALHGLDLEYCTDMVADALNDERTRWSELGAFLHGQTEGNPLAITQRLEELRTQGALFFDQGLRRFRWDSGANNETGKTSPDDIFRSRLERLSEECRDVLQTAATLEPIFDRGTLCRIYEDQHEMVDRSLSEATESTVIQRMADADQRGDPPLFHRYSFVHEKLRRFCYELLPLNEREERHLALARLFLQELSSGKENDLVLTIAHHYNKAEPLVVEPMERQKAAEVNESAAMIARKSGASNEVCNYLKGAMTFLEDEGWRTNYELTARIALGRAEGEYLSGRYEDANRLLTELLPRLRSAIELADVHIRRTKIYTQQYRFREAVREGALGLSLLGVPLIPGEESAEQVLDSLSIRVTELLKGKSDLCLLERQWLMDPAELAAQQLLLSLFVPTYNSDSVLNAIVTMRLVEQALTKGHSALSSLCYMSLGIYHALRHNPSEAERFGRLSLKLASLHPEAPIHSQLNHMFGCWVSPWCEDLTASLSSLTRAYHAGVEEGDLVFAGCAIMIKVIYEVTTTEEIEGTLDEWRSYETFLQKSTQKRPLATLKVSQQLLKALAGRTVKATSFDDDSFNEVRFLEEVRAEQLNVAEAWYYLAKIQLLLLWGATEEASAFLRSGREIVRLIAPGTMLEADAIFYSALHEIMLADKGSDPSLSLLQEGIERLRSFSSNCPQNFLYKALLLEAEKARLSGLHLDAMKLYREASQAASNAPLVAAFIHERTASLYSEHSLKEVASLYQNRAVESYLKLGAMAKVHHLSDLHHASKTHEEERQGVIEPGSGRSHPRTSSLAKIESLDFEAIISASQAVSRELNVTSLLDSFMQIILENSGAQRAVLLVRDEKGTLRAEREGFIEEGALHMRVPGSAVELPATVVDYVLRTSLDLVVDDALAERVYMRDPYIERHKPCSMLGKPIVVQGALMGLLYLENRLLRGAFNEQRIALLNVMTAQMVISLENARLVSRLQQSEEKLQTVLRNMLDGVFALDVSGRVTLINEAGRRLLRSDGETVFSDLAELFERLQVRDALGRVVDRKDLPHLRALAGETVPPMDLFFGDEGKENALQVTAAPIRDQNECVTGAVGVARDVTQLIVLDRLKDEFLRAVAHELKTPLSVIRGYAQLADRPNARSLNLDITKHIVAGVDQMSALVNELLDVWLIRAGKFRVERRTIELIEIVKGCADEIAARDTGADVVFRAEAPSVATSGDPVRLKQLLHILIGNACKFSPGRTRVEVGIQRVDTGAVVSIKDSGVGIPRGKQAGIFQHFYRAHADTRHDFGGIGGGLFIAREIVTLHGGRVWFESEEGKGSTFFFTLPLHT